MALKSSYVLPVTVDNVSTHVSRKNLQNRQSSVLEWLESVDVFPKWYFKTGIGNEYGACGALLSFPHLPELSCTSDIPNPPRIIGGQDFFQAPRKGDLWEKFPTSLYSLPMFETYTDGSVISNSLTPTHPKISYERSRITPPPLCLNRYDIPSKETWCESLTQCIRDMKRDEYDKIVLARAARFQFSSPISPTAIIEHLTKKSVNSVVFMIALSENLAFVGATPEFLFQKKDSQVQTHAIAGTRQRGSTVEQDLELEKELLASCKEQSEFSYVHQDIQHVLSQLCGNLEFSPSSDVIKTAAVQHLIRSFQGTLHADVSPQMLLNALHPTPAVGGAPRDSVLKKIYALESFDRGWYAAPFGYVTNGESKVVVAIRSALVSQTNLVAFAGTGIVDSSDPHLEWEELNNKISQFTQWIG